VRSSGRVYGRYWARTSDPLLVRDSGGGDAGALGQDNGLAARIRDQGWSVLALLQLSPCTRLVPRSYDWLNSWDCGGSPKSSQALRPPGAIRPAARSDATARDAVGRSTQIRSASRE
jgi:hypothetical protein